MENNLLIGILKKTDEDCCHAYFLCDTPGGIKLHDRIYMAHKKDVFSKSGPPRLMLVKCSTPKGIMIMENVKSLKSMKNEGGLNIYVLRQQPKSICEK